MENRVKYTETERRVMQNDMLFSYFQTVVEHAQATMDMLESNWNNYLALKEYMDSGLWLKDYEADEQGKIRKAIPRGILSQDALYNALQDMEDVLRRMKALDVV